MEKNLIAFKYDKPMEKKVENFAVKTISKVETKSKLLSTSITQLAKVSNMGNGIEENIDELGKKFKELNPSNIDFLNYKRNTIFNPVKKYFNKIKLEESNIAKSIKELEKKKKILERDNITLEIEVNNILEITKIIDEEYENGVAFKEEIIGIIEKATKEQDQTKAKYYTQTVLEPIEKKLFDLKQMSLVKKQSGIALEVIRNNNKEIIRNIEKITDVTFVALNTAIIVAKAIYNQKISLRKITELEKGTENFIKNIGKAVKKEEISITNSSVEDLKKAFNDAYSVINDAQMQNKKVLPENELKLMELKNKK